MITETKNFYIEGHLSFFSYILLELHHKRIYREDPGFPWEKDWIYIPM